MNEETLLEQKFGKQNPFRVPEGYFSDFEKKLLENIPMSAPVKKPVLRHLNPWLWSAVSIAAVVCGVVFFVSKPASDDIIISNAATITAPAQDNDDNIIDEVSDYAMLDNSDLYSYVAGE